LKFAFLADIHANLEAFTAALSKCDELGVDRVFHLGDLVGYGADPEACVDLAASRNILGVQGNHDAVACGDDDGERFNPVAFEAIRWTRSVLSTEARLRLGALPRNLRVDDLLLCHGAPGSRDRYIEIAMDVQDELTKNRVPEGVRVVFFGHTHQKTAFYVQEEGEGSGRVSIRSFGKKFQEIDTNGKLLCFLNPGSVGQPRDGNIDRSFLVFDTETRIANYVRFSYDVRAAQRKILKAGLPKALADRLVPKTEVRGIYM